MAAAFAALVSLINNLDLILNHPTHSFSFELKQIQSLQETTSFLIDFLKRCDYSSWIRKEAVEALERRIAHAAEAAEDVVESHVVDQIRSGKTTGSKTRSSRFLLDLQKVTLDLVYMRRKATNIKKVQSTGVEAVQQQPPPPPPPPPSYSSTTDKNSTTMVGFDGVLLQILDTLTGVPSSRQVIPIVGMGGMGKTFLARNVFQHPTIVERFHICLWATISQQYTRDKIFTQLVHGLRVFKSKAFDEPTSYRNTDEDLQDELHKGLYGRRYLIVLDDMWSVQAWDHVKFFFPDTNNGSRILVTTRLSNVANHFSVAGPAMHFLDGINSWDLFCKKTFAENGCPAELEEIGKKIVEKCKGLPLAIVVAAGHLKYSSMTLEYWENVANHMDSVLNSAESEEQCMNVLSLSYSYLPPHLKPCFLLLGSFPEDEDIYGYEIGNLWISEGLIEPTKNILVEKVVEDYLLDLYGRNLILVDGLGFHGKIVYFKLHDLVRELCLQIAEKEEFLFVLDSPGSISRERRVAINGTKVGEAKKHQLRRKTLDAPLRGLIYEGGWPSHSFKLLRTLNRVVHTTTGLPIFQQVNLRCLKVDLEHTAALHIFYLPSSISLLWNLQILKIDFPISLVKVVAPYEIWEMLQLRHLEIIPICLVDPLPVERSDERSDDLVMKNLQTLLNVENFRLSEDVCKRIPNITQLQLLYLDEGTSDYYPHNLRYFQKLKFFTCNFDGNGNWRDFASSLTFPTSLEALSLYGCQVDWEEMTTMVGSLPNLISLRLLSNAVIGSVWTTVEEKFLSLKNLEISKCDELVHLNVESSHFPVLRRLHLRNLPNLDELCPDIGEITTLGEIAMEYCSVSSSISAIRTLVEQEEQGNPDLRVSISLKGDEEALESFNRQVQEENLTSNNLNLDLQIE